jgi:hypothetical protein
MIQNDLVFLISELFPTLNTYYYLKNRRENVVFDSLITTPDFNTCVNFILVNNRLHYIGTS